VGLPKKHGRGGQLALWFARTRLEKRHNYVRKVSEFPRCIFIDYDTNQPNCKYLVIAGSAEFKLQLIKPDLFDPRLKQTVLKLVDMS
jgi:peptide chain release factor subunit 1